MHTLLCSIHTINSIHCSACELPSELRASFTHLLALFLSFSLSHSVWHTANAMLSIYVFNTEPVNSSRKWPEKSVLFKQTHTHTHQILYNFDVWSMVHAKFNTHGSSARWSVYWIFRAYTYDVFYRPNMCTHLSILCFISRICIFISFFFSLSFSAYPASLFPKYVYTTFVAIINEFRLFFLITHNMLRQTVILLYSLLILVSLQFIQCSLWNNRDIVAQH